MAKHHYSRPSEDDVDVVEMEMSPTTVAVSVATADAADVEACECRCHNMRHNPGQDSPMSRHYEDVEVSWECKLLKWIALSMILVLWLTFMLWVFMLWMEMIFGF